MSEPLRPISPPPLLEGPPEVEEGYYDLEEHERNQSWVTMHEKTDAVALWYRALTLYRRAMLGTWEFKGLEPGSVELAAWGLQMQLLGLGVSAAKSSLDGLLAGYYSQAFGGIRHMLETFVQCLYVSFNPDEAYRWYEQAGGISAQVDPPSIMHMCQAINAEPGFKGTGVPGLMDKVYSAWNLMSKGAHPSGVGILQTAGEGDVQHLIGATYRPDLCLAGFDIGLFAVATLSPQALRMAKPEIGSWSDEWEQVSKDVGAWRTAHEAELRAGEGADFERGTSPPVRRPVPQVSMKDIERCHKLLQLRYEQMNWMPLLKSKSDNGNEETGVDGVDG